MSAELPLISAVIARLEDPAIHLAAYGSVVFPLAIIIEAPIIMMLAASTALSKDRASYQKIRKYMMLSGLGLTLLHFVIALTPLFDWVVGTVMGVPSPIIDPARTGFLIMTPWTWSIAYRRFNQGVLIRFGHSKVISVGTLIRLFTDAGILFVGFTIGSIPGVVVASLAVALGVILEAVFVGVKVAPVVRKKVFNEPKQVEELTFGAFLSFYIPLGMTSFLLLAVQPMMSSALSRMPDPLMSLAVWPVVYGLMFVLRCLGHAYQEVVVALMDEPKAKFLLRRFAFGLAGATTGVLLLIAATPLADLWFEVVCGLPNHLSNLAKTAVWFGVFLPAFSVFQNWLQGLLVHSRKTRNITEAVIVSLVVTAVGLWVGVIFAGVPGVYVGLIVFTVGSGTQLLWLFLRVRVN